MRNIIKGYGGNNINIPFIGYPAGYMWEMDVRDNNG
jgi:hypothetical protein